MTLTAAGSLFGLAYGDALGKPTEFLSVERIGQAYGPDGPADLPEPALVTDDTQMALAVGRALLETLGPDAAGVPGPLTADRLAPALARHFVDWARSPENNRAPGRTCLDACAGLARGEAWVDATVSGSKGCGANMRVTPVGLVPGLSPSTRAGAAQLQAAMTHGHPTGLAASDLTAYATFWLNTGMDPKDLVPALRDRCRTQRENYHEAWLAQLWTRSHATCAEAFIARGWDECSAALDRLDQALEVPDRESDPCIATGDGWVAEEALATALHCFLLYPDEPVRALRRAAVTRGDSDSIAALAGAFAGARHGLAAFPDSWRDRIEYGGQLAALAEAWDAAGAAGLSSA